MTLYEKHITYIEKVNNSRTEEEHQINELYLMGWRDGVRDAGGFISLINADLFYLNQGIDRPMFGGVWLDWSRTCKLFQEDKK